MAIGNRRAMYANFGSLGVLIGMWLVGIIIGSVYNKNDQNKL